MAVVDIFVVIGLEMADLGHMDMAVPVGGVVKDKAGSVVVDKGNKEAGHD